MPNTLRAPRRLGLSGGTGGGDVDESMPFFKDALAGKSTVSMVDVDDMNVGSEIEAFETVFLRRTPVRGWNTGMFGCGAEFGPCGVFAPDVGGVGICII